MRPKRPIADTELEVIGSALLSCSSIEAFRRVLCIWLRVKLDMDAARIAEAVNLTIHAVRKNQGIYFRKGIEALSSSGRGGRWHENMGEEEEREMLNEFLSRAESGGVIVASDIKAAYELKLGRNVPRSTVYRMLDRHGWRKILPRARHPKADPRAMEEFKKNFPR